MKTQTIGQAIRAIEAAGHRAFARTGTVRFYDPHERRAYLTIGDGYCDAEFENYCEVECKSYHKGGPSGAFKAEIRKILEADRKSR